MSHNDLEEKFNKIKKKIKKAGLMNFTFWSTKIYEKGVFTYKIL